MKILVIGRSYSTAFAQQKYATMKALDPSLRLCVVVPPEIGFFSRTLKAERHPDLTEEIAVVPGFGDKYLPTYCPNPIHLGKIIRQFLPDVALIEEDPHSPVGAVSSLLIQTLRPSAKLAFFTWDNLARQPRFPIGIIKRALTRYSFSQTDLIICGNSEAQLLLSSAKHYQGASTVLPQVGVEPYDPRAEANNARPVIGYVGRLVPEKGLALLFNALKELLHLQWQLKVVGSGPLSLEIQETWQPVFGERFSLQGAVAHKDVPNLLRSLDIFVLPSRTTPTWKEQFGLPWPGYDGRGCMRRILIRSYTRSLGRRGIGL